MSGSVNREIKISASDTGVFDKLSKLKEGALALGRGIAEDSKNQATSSRELIKLMKDEIALIEKRNRLSKESRELSAQDKYSGDSKGLKEEMQKIQIESKEDSLQTELLKEILQGILKTSREQISADRENVKKTLKSEDEVDAMSDEDALKSILTRQMIEDTEEEGGDGGRDRVKSTLAGMNSFVRETDMYTMGFQSSGDFLTKRSENTENKLGSRLLLAGGMVLGALGMTISAASEQMEGYGDVFRASGGGGYGSVKDMTTAQANKRAAQLNLAAGEHIDGGRMSSLLSYERSHGIDSSSLAKMTRYSSSEDNKGVDPVVTMGLIKNIMGDYGMNKSRTDDLLQGILSLQEQQYMATGKGSSTTNASILNRIMSGQERADAVRASATAGRVNQMIQGGSDQLEAIKFSEYQKNHGGSYLDYLEEKEKGIAGSVGQDTISRVLSSNMNESDKRLSLISLGFGSTESKEIMKAGGVGGLGTSKSSDPEAGINWESAWQEGKSAEAGGTNKVMESSAWVTDGFATVGTAAIDLAETLVGAAQTVGGWFNGGDGSSPKPGVSNRVHR